MCFPFAVSLYFCVGERGEFGSGVVDRIEQNFARDPGDGQDPRADDKPFEMFGGDLLLAVGGHHLDLRIRLGTVDRGVGEF